jgi:hypothetical protein
MSPGSVWRAGRNGGDDDAAMSSWLYWVGIAAGAVAFAVIVVTARSGREELRFFRAALIVYVAAWALIVGVLFGTTLLYGVAVGLPWPVWDFPTALLVGSAAIFIGGHALAGLFRMHQARVARGSFKPDREFRSYSDALTPAELDAANAYDEQWQVEDRERERKRRA